MGEVIWGHDFSARKNREGIIEGLSQSSHAALVEYAKQGVPLVCRNGETLTVHRVELPADCPA